MNWQYIKKGFLLIFADILSLITVALCLIQKLPQIRDLYGYRSARGISATSLYLELFSYSTMMLYNYTYEYSLLSYMEYPVLIVQEYILVALVLQYKRMLNQNTIIYICGYFALMLLFAYQILPRFLIAMLVPFCTPIGATSKIIQLLEILRTKDSTMVSLTTWFLSAFTNLTRVYTTAIETGDTMLLTNFTLSFILSASVYMVAFYYKRNRSTLLFFQKNKILLAKNK